MATDPRVLVAGGGPAGLAAALAIRGHGSSVAVLDQGAPGRDKACGEGLMPDAVRTLTRLGVPIAAVGRPFRGIRYLDEGLWAEGRFPGEPGRGVRRPLLHRLLVEAAERSGVELRWGVRVDGFDGETLQTSAGPLRADWIVAADGLHSSLRRWAGLAASPRGRRRFGVRRHFRIAPWSDRVEVHWGDRTEAYVTPVDRDLVGVALLWSEEKAGFDRLLDRFPRLRQRLGDAVAASRDRGAGDFRQRVPRVARGRLALVGDASGYVDPLTGEGLGLAFRQAEALARSLAAGDLAGYARAHRRLGRRAWALTRLLLVLEPRPRLRRSAIGLLAGVPGLFSGILRWMTGEG